MFEIKLMAENGTILKAEEHGEKEAVLTYMGEYRRGYQIHFTFPEENQYYVVRVDDTMDESFVFVKQKEVVYTIPFYEKKTSYNPKSFAGCRHYVSARRAKQWEIDAYKNLAKNPFAQHEESGVYPFAYANVETRGEAVFAARNAIDGFCGTKSHGEWPYESWGINRQDDAEITIDFGRPVDIDEVVLYTRADFPHDNWWVKGTLSFSDGTTEEITLDKKVQEPQSFAITRKGITWISLGSLIKADDPSPFPALTQIEVYGTESK